MGYVLRAYCAVRPAVGERRPARWERGWLFNLHPFAAPLADVDNVEGKFDLAMRSNKWEGEDEEEEVKVNAISRRVRDARAPPRALRALNLYGEHMFPHAAPLGLSIISLSRESFVFIICSSHAWVPCDYHGREKRKYINDTYAQEEKKKWPGRNLVNFLFFSLINISK